MERYEYPFSALVGQEKLKTALLLNLVEPRLGGVLIQGEKGTAKSTAVRGLAELMDEVEVAEGLVEPITLGGKITAPVHSGIRIFENEITLTDGYALWSKGGGDIEIDDKDHPVHIEPLDK